MNDRPRVAVITGAGQGLGAAVARAFDAAGFAIAALGRTGAKLDRTCRDLTGPSLALTVDLADAQAVRMAFERLDAQFGGVDVLVNNAATYRPFLIGEATAEQLRQTVEGTLLSALYCIREAIPRMRSRGSGDIVTVTSESVRTPAPFLTLYAAAKAALEVVHHGLRGELRGSGVRAMIFESGRISESSVAEQWDEAMLERFTRAFVEQGYAATMASEGVSPDTLAATILHMATAPREAVIEVVRMRAGA